MNNSKTMLWVGTVVFLTFALFNILTLVTLSSIEYPFGPAVAGPYSIYASKNFFIAYHVWGIIMPFIATYAMWREAKMLFWISLLLLILLQFYPYFTSSPIDRAAGQAIEDRQKAVEDSLRALQAPLQLDSLAKDSNK
jgi:hypothetical protein